MPSASAPKNWLEGQGRDGNHTNLLAGQKKTAERKAARRTEKSRRAREGSARVRLQPTRRVDRRPVKSRGCARGKKKNHLAGFGEGPEP